ncbi:MAG: DUF4123 domain-containing protein [Planctomycetes bacterium]|nr:DUF4123 domain-containing protein [Planctomycetota bacterium]
MDESGVDSVLERMGENRPFATRLYVLLDAARNPQIWPAIRDAEEQHICLFAGKLEPAVVEVAPYIVALEPDAAFTKWLLAKGWGDSWGIWFAAPVDLDELQKHFRHFTQVRDDNQKTLYFRFYDPRVWRDYMELADDSDRGQLFGPVDCFWSEGKSPAELITYTRESNGAVKSNTQPVSVTTDQGAA